MNYTIHYNATTNHIAGHGIKATLATEFTMNHCGSLTRSRLALGKSFETAAEALAYLETNTRRVCKTCLKALMVAVETEAAEAAAEVVETVVTPAQPVTVTEATDLPQGVWMDQRTGVLFGRAKDLSALITSGKARLSRAGDVVLTTR